MYGERLRGHGERNVLAGPRVRGHTLAKTDQANSLNKPLSLRVRVIISNSYPFGIQEWERDELGEIEI